MELNEINEQIKADKRQTIENPYIRLIVDTIEAGEMHDTVEIFKKDQTENMSEKLVN